MQSLVTFPWRQGGYICSNGRDEIVVYNYLHTYTASLPKHNIHMHIWVGQKMTRQTFFDLISLLFSLHISLSVAAVSSVPGVSYRATGTSATVPGYCVIVSVSDLHVWPSWATSFPRRLLMSGLNCSRIMFPPFPDPLLKLFTAY